MLAFTGKYGIDDLNLNKYTHTIKINFGKFLVSEMKSFFVNAGIGNTPLLEYGIVHAGIYWQIRDLPRVLSMPALLVS